MKTTILKRALRELGNDFELILLDIGCANGPQRRWMDISEFVRFVGVDANEDARVPNCHEFKEVELFLGAVVGNQGNFFFTNNSLASSPLEPNKPFLERFPKPQRFSVKEVEDISSMPLSDIPVKPSFIKMDVQGSEIQVLRSASSSFFSVTLGMEVECEFLPLYKGQPLFGEITTFLENLGFEFIDFVNPTRWLRNYHNKYFGQLIASDSLFLRSPELFCANPQLCSFYLKQYLAILLLYERFDLISTVKARLDIQDMHSFFVHVKRLENIQKLVRSPWILANRLLKILGSEKRVFLFG